MHAPGTKKLLVLTSTFPRWQDDYEPRFVELLCKELTKTYSVTVLAPHCKGARRYEEIELGDRVIHVHRFRYFLPSLQTLAYDGGILANIRGNALKSLLVPFFLLAQLFTVANLHRKNHFDTIHAHWIVPQGLVAAVFKTLWPNAPPFVVTSHGGDLFALRGYLLTAVKRWTLNKAAKITVVSQSMKVACEEFGVDADKIVVRSMGVDLVSTFTTEVDRETRANLVFVGRLVEKKGVRYLIQAMVPLVAKYSQLSLTIVGEGPEREQLEQMAFESGLENHISFVGSRLNTELPEILRLAKIAVMPSIVAKSGDQEGLGLVAIEAMGCGCAVVATDLAAIRDSIQHGQTGLIAAAGNEVDLAEKIDSLLSDENLARTIAASGREFAARNFDWQIVGEQYAELLSDLRTGSD